MSHPGNAIGYHGIMDKRPCRNKFSFWIPRTVRSRNQNKLVAVCTKIQPMCRHNLAIPMGKQKIARQKWKQGVCLLNLYGWRKEHWTKGAAGTGSVDQQAVERHW